MTAIPVERISLAAACTVAWDGQGRRHRSASLNSPMASPESSRPPHPRTIPIAIVSRQEGDFPRPGLLLPRVSHLDA
jgi:hypothetical protein